MGLVVAGGTPGAAPDGAAGSGHVPEASTQSGERARAVVRLAAPSARNVVRMVLLLVASAVALYLLWRVRSVIRLIGISLFLGLALVPVVDAIDRRVRMHRAVIILGVYVVLLAAVVVIGAVVVPSMVKEIGQLSHEGPRYARELRENATFRHYDNRYHISSKLVADARALPHALAHVAGPLKDVTVSAFSFVGELVTVLALTFLLILHGRDYVNAGLSLAGEREHHYRRLIIEVNQAVSKYVLGNIIISLLATLATWIVLTILGVPYALSLGLVVGFFDLVTLVGATLGAIFVALATLTVSFPLATIVWIAFIVVWQRIEDYVVQPLVYGRALKVNPIVTIVAVLIGASLLGVLGALIASPTAAGIQIVLGDWWRTRRAGAREPREDGSRRDVPLAATDGLVP
ncbi:MAG: family transporter [Solirubrobacterales bacterium]|nr:family transporter [Solirubrobacterales bacterium]